VLNYRRPLLALLFDNRGVTALEYTLIAAFIATVIIGAVSAVGNEVTSPFLTLSSHL